nr:MAG TPA: hypothetical protein [Caudoviricetes sp.]
MSQQRGRVVSNHCISETKHTPTGAKLKLRV